MGVAGLSVHLPRPLASGQLVQVETLDPVASGKMKRIPCRVKWSASKDWAWQVGLHCNLPAEQLAESWLRVIYADLERGPNEISRDEERRKSKRFETSLTVDVELVASGENLSAQCVNVGHGGARLVSAQEVFHLEQYVRLRFGSGTLALTALCKVVNVHNTDDGRQWVGLSFAQSPSGQLGEFIDSCERPAVVTTLMPTEVFAARPPAKMEPVVPTKKISIDWEPPAPKAPQGDDPETDAQAAASE